MLKSGDIFCDIVQVVSIKAIGIAIKLTLDGINQITYPQTWFFLTVAVICVITQLNYLNKVSLLQSMSIFPVVMVSVLVIACMLVI